MSTPDREELSAWAARVERDLDREQRVPEPRASEVRHVPVWMQERDDCPMEGLDT